MKKSLVEAFNEFQRQDPGKSSIISFMQAITNRKMDRVNVLKYFRALVDPDDYAVNEQKIWETRMCKITHWKKPPVAIRIRMPEYITSPPEIDLGSRFTINS